VPFMGSCGQTLWSQRCYRRQYGTCALHAGYLTLQTHAQNMQQILFFHRNNGCTNTPQCYVICTLSTLLTTSGDWRRTIITNFIISLVHRIPIIHQRNTIMGKVKPSEVKIYIFHNKKPVVYDFRHVTAEEPGLPGSCAVWLGNC